MPTVSIPREILFSRLGCSYTQEEFEDLCFAFGIELDDVTSEAEMVRRAQGENAAAGLSEEVLYKIDIPANRYDLLCVEGLSRALRVFLGKDKPPIYRVEYPAEPVELVVSQSTQKVRPVVVAAVLRNLSIDEASYNSLIDVQEKLHQTLCRRRALVAIGTHDLDTLRPPFRYEARAPREIFFQALKETKKMDAAELFSHYDSKPQCSVREYLQLIRSSPVYPVIYDSEEVVLSLPPIINGEHSKLTLNTRNLLIECTATDRTKADIVLNTICCVFSEYCASPFSIEAVRVRYQNGSSEFTPDLSSRTMSASLSYINKGIGGVQLGGAEVRDLARRMQLDPVPTRSGEDQDKLEFRIPPTRSDVLHACDVLEDVAIAYGFNNLKRRVPNCATVGREQPLNALSDELRNSLAQAGFVEVLTWALASTEECLDRMRLGSNESAVMVANPKTKEFQMVRVSLLAGLLKTLAANKTRLPLPVRLFEVSDVALLDPGHECGVANERRVAALYTSHTSGCEKIHGLLDRLMQLNDFQFAEQRPEGESINTDVYFLDQSDHRSFFPALCSDVWILRAGAPKAVRAGTFGVLHPDVLEAFGIDTPCSALELNVHIFL